MICSLLVGKQTNWKETPHHDCILEVNVVYVQAYCKHHVHIFKSYSNFVPAKIKEQDIAERSKYAYFYLLLWKFKLQRGSNS